MAADLAYFDQYFPYLFPGIGALAHAGSLSFNTENKDTDVETLFLDFAGITPSPKKTMVKVELFDPVSGSILGDLQKLEIESTICQMKIAKRGTSETMEISGFVRNVSASGGVGESSKVSFDFVGRPAVFS